MSVLSETTCELNKILMFLYRLFPGFCIGQGLLNLSMEWDALYAYEYYKPLGDTMVNESPVEMFIVGNEVAYHAIESVVYLLIAIGTDYAMSFPTIQAKVNNDPDIKDTPYETDKDIREEGRRVAQGGA